MKARWTMVLVAVAAVVFVGGGELFAQNNNTFHKSGSLVCSACHTIHDSVEGADQGVAGQNAHLLLQANTTDSCLDCHDETGTNADWSGDGSGSTPPKVMNATVDLPAGDFDAVKAGGAAGKGHSLDSTAFAAANLANAPGGGATPFSATGFGCTSCHDPHGDYNVASEFRNLLDTVNGVDVSAAITSVNADEAELRTDGAAANQNLASSGTNHNIYKGEVGAWCGACHATDNDGTGFHGTVETDADVGDNTDWIRHPTGTAFLAAYATNYGATTDFNYPIVTTVAGSTSAEWAVVAAESKVFCMSCHKAHASANTDATRWDTSVAQASNVGCGKCHGR